MSSARGQRRVAGGPGHPVRRRRQVLQGMADGLTARQVAHRLGISRRTVEGHLRVLRELTGARSIGELCAVSVAEGWVTPGRLAPRVALDGLGARSSARPEPLRSCPETGWFPDGLTMFDGKLADLGHPPGPVHGRAANAARDAAAPVDRTGRRPGGRPTVMTRDRITAARQLLLAHSVTDTARRLGISRSTLYAHLAEINESGQQDTPATGSAGPP